MLDIKKTCRNCGKVFKPYYGRQIYCCETCRLAVERTKRREQRNLESSKKIVDKNGQLLSNKTHLSISHAALFLNFSRPTIYKRIEAGELHPIKLGKRTIRIPIHELLSSTEMETVERIGDFSIAIKLDEVPQLSAVLSGTPHQINSLIPNAENGLFSRFIFYTMNTQIVWQNVFATNGSNTSIDHYFFALGQEYKQFYDILKAGRKHRFTFTQNQMAEFQEFFDKTQTEFFENNGHEIIGSVRRMGLITFRIAMILTTVRLMYTN